MSKRSEMLRQKNRLEAEEAMRKELSKAHSLGIARGAYAMCHVVLEKAKNESVPIEDRLSDVIEFCSKARNPDERKQDEPEDNADEV